MTNPDQRPADDTASEQPDVLDSPDAYAPGGEPRTGDEEAAAAAPEADAAEASAGDATTEDTIRQELEALRDRHLRLAAEFDNFRRRMHRERQEAGTRAQADLLRPLLEPLDDLARVADLEPATTDAAAIIEGVGMVEQKFLKVLGAAGLEVVNPVDQAFDPNVHEAVSTEPALSREDDGLVARVYQVGYLFKGVLLRPARVVVRQWNG